MSEGTIIIKGNKVYLCLNGKLSCVGSIDYGSQTFTGCSRRQKHYMNVAHGWGISLELLWELKDEGIKEVTFKQKGDVIDASVSPAIVFEGDRDWSVSVDTWLSHGEIKQYGNYETQCFLHYKHFVSDFITFKLTTQHTEDEENLSSESEDEPNDCLYIYELLTQEERSLLQEVLYKASDDLKQQAKTYPLYNQKYTIGYFLRQQADKIHDLNLKLCQNGKIKGANQRLKYPKSKCCYRDCKWWDAEDKEPETKEK